MSCLSRPRRRAARLSAFAALLLLASAAAPAFAQQCNANPSATIAMPNQTVPDRTPSGGSVVVTLNAAASNPNSGNQSPTFAWLQTGSTPPGTSVALQNANTRIASFTVPDVAGPTALTFSFTITCGTRSSTATAVVNITNVVFNSAPHAAISVAPALVAEGDLVTLDGSGSYDIDNTPNTSGLTYQWTQLGSDGLPVADGVLLQPSATSATVTFTAPNNPSATTGSTLDFRLTVSDGTLQGTATTPVVVTWANDPPFAHIVCPAGGFVVGEGDAVTLDGSGSFDHDDGIASYLWTQVNGTPDAGVTGTATPVLAFNAPALGHGDLGALYFQLQVKDASAADGMGQPAIAECTVFVDDVTAPALSLPDAMNLDADSAAGSDVATYAVSALDNVDGDISDLAACTPPAPHLFPLGTTAVDCDVEDSAGNAASGSFDVTVSDLSPPVFDATPADIAMQGDTVGGANVAYDIPSATDKVDADVAVDCVPPPGFFALGTTPVTCTATDDAGHTASVGFDVTVYDFVPPEIAGAADQTVEATSPAGAVASFVMTATDVVDDDVGVLCDHASGDTFPLGATLVSCSATDDSGNTANAGFTVTVVDTTAPELTPPADVTQEATGPLTAVGYGAASATDLVDTDVAIQCLPASGSAFAVGVHAITCTATDDAGNSTTAGSSVTVTDTTGPAITVPGDMTVEATSAAGAIATFAASAVDLVDGPRPVACVPPSGSQFALGDTAVACTSSDTRDNGSGAGFSVHVVDTTAPVIAPHDDVSATATSAAGAIVEYVSPAASDLVDGDLATHCTPASGSQFALGATTVTCTATDDAGNSASSTFTVTVRYGWAGFFRPVDNGVLNSVKAGSAVPVKFSLGGNMGLGIFASGHPRTVSMQCATGTLEDAVEETVNAGGSSLQYDASANQYVYVWKTEKSWTGTCRQLQLKLADGTTQVANFKFK